MKARITIATLAVLFFCWQAAAQATQPSWRLGFSANPGLATQSPFQSALGGDLFVLHRLSDKTALSFSAGYTHFFEKDHFKDYTQYGSPFNVIPVKAGIRYYEGDNFYLSGEAGVGIGFEQWHTGFVWSPGVGMSLRNGTDISLHYEDFTITSVTKQIALHFAWSAGLRKPAAYRSAPPSTQSANIFRHPNWLFDASLTSGAGIPSPSQYVLGATVGVQRKLNNNLAFTLHTGFTHFFPAGQPYHYVEVDGTLFREGDKNEEHNLIPVKAGLMAYPTTHIYLGAEAGIGIDINGNSSFVWSPAAGYVFNRNWSAGAFYEKYTNFARVEQLALQVTYHL